MGEAQIISWIGTFSYPAVFALLVACGVGAPLSEDVIVVVGGMIVGRAGGGYGHLALMAFTAYLGKLVGDFLIFRIGRRLGPRVVEKRRFRKLLTPQRVRWAHEHFERRGVRTVFIARFLPGLRAPTFLLAGSSQMKPLTFLLADAAAACVTAPLLTWLGFRFGASVLKDLKVASHWVVGGAALVVGAFLIVKLVRRHLRVKRGISDLGAATFLERLGALSDRQQA